MPSKHRLASQRLKQLFSETKFLYINSTRPLASWLWNSHLSHVYKHALNLSEKYGATTDLAAAGALLHDLGDVWLERTAPSFEVTTETEIRRVLEESGYALPEVERILADVIAPHSCYPGYFPTSLEGKVLATADALAHLLTDFYEEARQRGLPSHAFSGSFNDWAREKIERDFNSKIFFDEVKKEVEPRYRELVKKYQ